MDNNFANSEEAFGFTVNRNSTSQTGETGAGKNAGQTGAGETGAGETGAGETGAGETGAGETGAGELNPWESVFKGQKPEDVFEQLNTLKKAAEEPKVPSYKSDLSRSVDALYDKYGENSIDIAKFVKTASTSESMDVWERKVVNDILESPELVQHYNELVQREKEEFEGLDEIGQTKYKASVSKNQLFDEVLSLTKATSKEELIQRESQLRDSATKLAESYDFTKVKIGDVELPVSDSLTFKARFVKSVVDAQAESSEAIETVRQQIVDQMILSEVKSGSYFEAIKNQTISEERKRELEEQSGGLPRTQRILTDDVKAERKKVFGAYFGD